MQTQAGVDIEFNTSQEDFGGVKMAYGPKILMDPTFAVSIKELKAKVTGSNRISKDSVLILRGKDSRIENLSLDGYLVVENGTVATGEVKNNERVEFIHTTAEDPEVYRISGFKHHHVK